MVGVAKGEARLVIEAGASRFPVHARIGGKPVTAATLLEVLPQLSKSLEASLQRVAEREARK